MRHTLSKPVSQPWEEKVEDKYIKSCLNLNPSFKISGEASKSLSDSQSEDKGMQDKSSRKTTESPPDSSESDPSSGLSWQAI